MNMGSGRKRLLVLEALFVGVLVVASVDAIVDGRARSTWVSALVFAVLYAGTTYAERFVGWAGLDESDADEFALRDSVATAAFAVWVLAGLVLYVVAGYTVAWVYAILAVGTVGVLAMGYKWFRSR